MRRPVRQRVAKPAPFDSCFNPDALGFDLLERAAVRLERGLFAGELLPALDDDVDILRIKFDPVADALSEFRCPECGAATQERIVNQLTRRRWFRIGRRISSIGFCVG